MLFATLNDGTNCEIAKPSRDARVQAEFEARTRAVRETHAHEPLGKLVGEIVKAGGWGNEPDSIAEFFGMSEECAREAHEAARRHVDQLLTEWGYSAEELREELARRGVSTKWVYDHCHLLWDAPVYQRNW